MGNGVTKNNCMNDYLLKTIIAISSLSNLYFIFHSIPEKQETINFWKNQCNIWRDSYFKQLNDEKNDAEDARAFRRQGRGQQKDSFTPGPPPENGDGEGITG
jgi:hypothetical protein